MQNEVELPPMDLIEFGDDLAAAREVKLSNLDLDEAKRCLSMVMAERKVRERQLTAALAENARLKKCETDAHRIFKRSPHAYHREAYHEWQIDVDKWLAESGVKP